MLFKSFYYQTIDAYQQKRSEISMVRQWIDEGIENKLNMMSFRLYFFRQTALYSNLAFRGGILALLGVVSLVLSIIPIIWFPEVSIFFTATGGFSVLIGTAIFYFASGSEEAYQAFKAYAISVFQISSDKQK